MKYTVKVKGSFKKAFKLCIRRGLNPDILKIAVQILAETGNLPSEYFPHPLHGNYEGYMECHLQPDWLLVWKQNDTELILVLVTTGSHSDIFGKNKK